MKNRILIGVLVVVFVILINTQAINASQPLATCQSTISNETLELIGESTFVQEYKNNGFVIKEIRPALSNCPASPNSASISMDYRSKTDYSINMDIAYDPKTQIVRGKSAQILLNQIKSTEQFPRVKELLSKIRAEKAKIYQDFANPNRIRYDLGFKCPKFSYLPCTPGYIDLFFNDNSEVYNIFYDFSFEKDFQVYGGEKINIDYFPELKTLMSKAKSFIENHSFANFFQVAGGYKYSGKRGWSLTLYSIGPERSYEKEQFSFSGSYICASGAENCVPETGTLTKFILLLVTLIVVIALIVWKFKK